MESIYLKVTQDYTPSDKEARSGGKDSVITVEKGDIIFDVRKDDDGWMCGKNLNSGRTGRFPSNCVANLSDEKTNSSPKTTERKDSLNTKTPNLSRDTKTVDTKRTGEPTGSLRRPPNPRPFGLSSRYPRPYDREKKESSGDSGVGAEEGEDYYLNDDIPDKKKLLDSRKIPSESETRKPSIYDSRFGSKTHSPIYSTRPSVSKLKSAFLDNDQKATKPPDMKGKDKAKESIEMAKKPSVNSQPKDKEKKIGKPALAAEEDDNDSMYASAEVDGKPAADVNKNKKPNTSTKIVKDKKVNIKDNPLSKEKPPPYHSYQVPQGPDKPPRIGGCADCDEPHIYADPAADHYLEPEGTSPKYDFDPKESQQKKLLDKTSDDPKSEANRRSFNRMASYESISNVGPDKNVSKARSTESVKDAMKAVKKTKQKLTSPDKYPKIRIVVGSLLGIFFGVFVFLLFYLVIPLHIISAIVAGIIVGLVLAMTFGFLDRRRLLCIILLIFPSIFASRGKIALWILIVYFLIAGPLCNFISNVNIIALYRGECFVVYAGSAESNNTSSNGTDDVNLSYERVVYPLFQRYVDTIDQLNKIVNTTSTPWHNKTTLQKLCADYSFNLRNNCLSLAEREYQQCMSDSKDPSILKRCQTLESRKVCVPLESFENACVDYTGDIVTLVQKTLEKAPGHATLAGYRYDNQPTLITPAKKRCENGVFVLAMLLPLLIILVLYEAYSYHKLYLARNDFDNQYLTNHFKTIEDTRKASGSTDGLLPLKKCEHQRFIQPTSVQFTAAERKNMLKYLLVYVIFLVFALVFILCDYYLYYVVSKEDTTEGSPMKNTNTNSTNTTTTTSNTTSEAAAVVRCLPLVLPLDEYYVIVISLLLGLLLLMIVIQSYVLRLRHFIASHLYHRRERKRIAYVYYKLLEERKAFYKAVIDNINMESEENYAMDRLDAVRVLAWNFTPMEKLFSILGVSLRKCMVCNRGLNRQYVYCDTDNCESIYCRTCFWDLGNKCLGCMRDSNPVTRSSSFIQGSSRKRKADNTTQGV